MTVIERDALIAQAAKAIPPGMAGAYPDTTRRAVAAEMLGPALDQLEGAVSERDFWKRRATDLGAKADEWDAGTELMQAYKQARERGQS